MELTRRDALKALALGGGSAGVSLLASETLVDDESSAGADGYTDADVETLYCVAEVVYPSAVDVTREFVETYVRRLPDERQAMTARTVEQLNSATASRYGRAFVEDDSPARREAMLRSLGVHRVESTPDGTVPERVRYHLVNTLLYALFTSPTGSKLVGIPSPWGHPGGFAAYRNEDT